MATKKAPVKMKTTTKAVSATKRKVLIKKVVSKKKTVAKKKHPFARLLEIRKKGSITKKGFLIGAGVVVVAVLAFTGYSVWQGMSANAGGAVNLGRGWTVVNGSTSSDNAKHGGYISYELSACKTSAGSSKYYVSTSLHITAKKGTADSVEVRYTYFGSGSDNGTHYGGTISPTANLKWSSRSKNPLLGSAKIDIFLKTISDLKDGSAAINGTINSLRTCS
jgi:hypothetical protein